MVMTSLLLGIMPPQPESVTCDSPDSERVHSLPARRRPPAGGQLTPSGAAGGSVGGGNLAEAEGDRKSTRLNSSHVAISYAVFCLKKKKKPQRTSCPPLRHCTAPRLHHRRHIDFRQPVQIAHQPGGQASRYSPRHWVALLQQRTTL